MLIIYHANILAKMGKLVFSKDETLFAIFVLRLSCISVCVCCLINYRDRFLCPSKYVVPNSVIVQIT